MLFWLLSMSQNNERNLSQLKKHIWKCYLFLYCCPSYYLVSSKWIDWLGIEKWNHVIYYSYRHCDFKSCYVFLWKIIIYIFIYACKKLIVLGFLGLAWLYYELTIFISFSLVFILLLHIRYFEGCRSRGLRLISSSIIENGVLVKKSNASWWCQRGMQDFQILIKIFEIQLIQL